MGLQLVRPAKKHEQAASDYRLEHFGAGEYGLHGASLLEKKDSYRQWLEHLEQTRQPGIVDAGRVTSSTFFAVDRETGTIVGAIDIRHSLNDFLREYGGHIGYGVRPSQREKGHATEILRLGRRIAKPSGWCGLCWPATGTIRRPQGQS